MVEMQIAARGIRDPRVLTAMSKVPRHLFVPESMARHAYGDEPLPLGQGQTISQPYIVAYMTEMLELEGSERVLEVGTGSGYQTAVLAELAREVWTIEVIAGLAEAARSVLSALGYGNIGFRVGDGREGWPEHAPYDAIIVTAAPDHLPQPLAGQLKEGGRLVVPIGPQGSFQTLWLFEKRNGELEATNLGEVRFVPLTGTH